MAAPPLMTVPWFSESLTPEARDTIFAEFNSLSVLFQQVRGGTHKTEEIMSGIREARDCWCLHQKSDLVGAGAGTWAHRWLPVA